jgi:tRNA(Ile)-lysidine synthase
MNKFTRNLITEWRKLGLPFAEETFIVAVSGGADSVSLALALHDLKQQKKLKHNFGIAHFNHDLRGEESEKDAEFVKNLAKKLEFDFEFAKGKISEKGNLEENARLARYKFLAEVVEKTNAYGVLVAHTINDQAETFLMNLIRGSGLQGLSAMKTISEFQIADFKLNIIRPFLNWAKREETEKFCLENDFTFRQDEMNFDEKYFRVRVRKNLIPFLENFNPKIIENLAKTSKLLEVKNDTKNVEMEVNYLRLSELQNADKLRLYNTLRSWLKWHRGNLRNISLTHIELIEKLIFSTKSGKLVELPNGEIVRKKDGKLFFEKVKVEKS